MNDIYIFIFLISILNIFFVYKIVKGILSIYSYKKGFNLEAEIIDFLWIKTPPARLSYLFPKEQLKVTFRFHLAKDMYEKTELDIHFKFKKINFKSLPKKGNKIKVYVPKNRNPNKVTINKVNKTIFPLIGLSIMVIFSAAILFLIIQNI